MTHTCLSVFLSALALSLLAFDAASAACPTPAGDKPEGAIIYNINHKTPQFCDGTQWVGMGTKVQDTVNKLSCETGQTIKYDGEAWSCAEDGAGEGDNLGNHTATQNIDLGAYSLVGNGGTDGIHVAANGRVGIGTASPSNRLEVAGSAVTGLHGIYNASAPAGRRFWAQGLSSGTGHYYLGYRNDDAKTPGQLDAVPFTIQHGAPQSSLVLAANGNVGIGIAVPLNPLHVNGGMRLTLDGTGHAETDGLHIGSNIDGSSAWVWNYETTPLRFATSALERMRIAADGNVGIGTTEPQAKLHVAGDTITTGTATVATPIASSHAATKEYVDTAMAATGGGMYQISCTTYDTSSDNSGMSCIRMNTETGATECRYTGRVYATGEPWYDCGPGAPW